MGKKGAMPEPGSIVSSYSSSPFELKGTFIPVLAVLLHRVSGIVCRSCNMFVGVGGCEGSSVRENGRVRRQRENA